ncbi:MAG: protein kinase domain-containing protein [Candidatus Sumerlaeia bacterium]
MTEHGDLLEKYEIAEKIGKGGMGLVYRARQKSLDRPVAIKMLARELADSAEYVERFIAEAKTIARMRNHPNIVEVYDFIETPENFYIVMELVEGQPLNRLMQQEGRLPMEQSLTIMSEVARALDHAHQADVVHRDIKPENVFVDNHNHVKVMDFGVAHLVGGGGTKTRTGLVLGTPTYMSPEQARGDKVDARTDIYAMGVLLFQLATGSLPFVADTALAVAMKQITDDPPRPRDLNPLIPDLLEAAILKALKKNPDERFQTAREFADFLESAEMKQALGESRKAGLEMENIETVVDASPLQIDKQIETSEDNSEEIPVAPENSAEPDDKHLKPMDWLLAFIFFAAGLTLAYQILTIAG